MTPFYYEPRNVWLIPVTVQQADDLFRDAKLWYAHVGLNSWYEDPSRYESKDFSRPSSYRHVAYAIEVGAPDDN